MLAIHDSVQAVQDPGISVRPTAMLVTVSGELDAANVAQLAGRILNALNQHRPAAIALDLAGVSFVDAAAARELRVLHGLADDADCVMSVCAAQPIAWWIFNATGLTSIFPAPDGYRFQSEPGS